jgi:uncharacterized membrane protein YgaE (UPF0421/DUF939 family)
VRKVDTLRRALSRLRAARTDLIVSIVAAVMAWLIAHYVIGHPAPFFAPASAIIVLGQAKGMRTRRAIEVVLGVAGGILLADLVAQVIDDTTVTVIVLIVLTLTISTAAGASPILVTQATVSALYVAVIAPPAESLVPVRFIDALVGGTVALVCNQIALSRHPVAPLVAEMRGICERIVQVVDRTAAAVEQQDTELARDALNEARAIDTAVESLRTAVSGAREAVRLDPTRRHHRGGVQTVGQAVRQIDFVVRGCRILARASVSLTRWPQPSSPLIPEALRHLAAAVGYAGEALVAEVEGKAEPAHDFADRLDAACSAVIANARTVLDGQPPFPAVMIIGQLRAMTIDLMRGVGTDDEDLVARVDDALGFPSS